MVEIQPGLYLATRNRAKYYRLISKFFRNPIKKNLIFGLEREEFRNLKEDGVEKYPGLKEGIEKIHGFVTDSDSDEVAKQIQEDRDKIFQNGFNPTEFSQTDANERKVKELQNKLKEKYKDQGWDYEDFEESLSPKPDHISMQSRFLFYLTKEIRKEIVNREAEKVQNLLSTTNSFFNNHIKNWVPSFTDKLYGKSSTDYFQGVAILTNTFIEIDNDILTIFQKEKNK